MPSFALQVLDAGVITTLPIDQAVYDAAVAMSADKTVEVPAAAPAPEPAPTDVVVRALVDIPPFVDQNGRTVTLKAGDLATVPSGVARILMLRSKATLVALAILAAVLSGCAELTSDEPLGADPDSKCDNAHRWHKEQAAEQIGRNETRRQWHLAIAQDYWEAWYNGAICKGWQKRTPWQAA